MVPASAAWPPAPTTGTPSPTRPATRPSGPSPRHHDPRVSTPTGEGYGLLSGVFVVDPRPQVLRPLQRPRLELFDLPGGEPIGGVVLVLVPVRTGEPVPEVLEAELV